MVTLVLKLQYVLKSWREDTGVSACPEQQQLEAVYLTKCQIESREGQLYSIYTRLYFLVNLTLEG